MNRHDAEREMPMLGVPGRLLSRMAGNPGWRPDVWVSQKWMSEGRADREIRRDYGPNARIHADVRLDDECKNSHATFAITATISGAARRCDNGSMGCAHEAIARAFPELAGLIRWHLTSTDEPMHYIANTVYLAGDRDHSGRAANEPSSFTTFLQFGELPALWAIPRELQKLLPALLAKDRTEQVDALAIVEMPYVETAGDRASSFKYQPKYAFAGQGATRWHEGPFNTKLEANAFAVSILDHKPRLISVPTAWSEGKARELDAARRAAVWPDATDEELSQPRDKLEATLKARHPRLMEQFRCDMEAAGLFLFPADYVPPRI